MPPTAVAGVIRYLTSLIEKVDRLCRMRDSCYCVYSAPEMLLPLLYSERKAFLMC